MSKNKMVMVWARCTPKERAAVEALAAELERNISDTVRFVQRREVRARGLLPAEPQPVDIEQEPVTN